MATTDTEFSFAKLFATLENIPAELQSWLQNPIVIEGEAIIKQLVTASKPTAGAAVVVEPK